MDKPKLFAMALVFGDPKDPSTIVPLLSHKLAMNEAQAVGMGVADFYRATPANAKFEFIAFATSAVTRDGVVAILDQMDKPPQPEPQKVVQLVPEHVHEWEATTPDPNGYTRFRCKGCGVIENQSSPAS